jgi:hypothetical protein
VVQLTVQGNVITERDLVAFVRDELVKTGRRNGNIFADRA